MALTIHVEPIPLESFINKIKCVEGSFNSQEYIRKTSSGKFTIRGELLKFEEIKESDIEVIVENVKEIFALLFALSSSGPKRNEARVFKKVMQLGEICPSLILLKEMSISYRTINKWTKKIKKLETRLAADIVRNQRRLNTESLLSVLAIGKYLQRLRIKTAEEIKGFKRLSELLIKDKSVKRLKHKECPHKKHTKYLTTCVERWKKTVKIIKDILALNNQQKDILVSFNNQ